jgi:hypothetical protein
MTVLIALRSRLHLELISRILLAAVGGYVLSGLFAASVSLLPVLARADRVMTATMLAFVLWCVVAIWAFCARRALHAWLVCLACALPPALHLYLGGHLA